MDRQTEECRAKAARERRAAEESRRDALEDLDRCRAPEQIEEDHRIQGVERSDGQRAKQNRAFGVHRRKAGRPRISAARSASPARTISLTPPIHKPGWAPLAPSASIIDSISAASRAL